MPIKFNPLAGQFDLVGSGGGGGASYIDGEVQNFSALPETLGSPAVDSAYLVREAEGTWLLNRKPAGIYIRTANTGTRASDWIYAGEFPDVFNDANLVVYNNTDSTKNVKFDASAITTGTTRTIAVPDKNITLDDAGDSRTPSSHSSSHAAAGSDPISLNVEDLSDVTLTDPQTEDALVYDNGTWVNKAFFTLASENISPADIGAAADSHTHGNITNAGLVGTTANLPLKTGAGGIVEAGVFGTGAGEFAEGNHTHTQLHDKSHAMTDVTSHTAGNHKVFYSDGSGQIQELALGNSGEVLTSNGATSAPSFAAASGGVTAVGASTADVLSVSGSDLVADDGGTIDSADPFIKWDDTAGKLVYANPLSRPTGSFYVGLAPTTTALGTDAVNVQSARSAATRVASGSNAVNIGSQSTASGNNSVAIGSSTNQATATQSVAIGYARATNTYAVAIGAANCSATASSSAAFGFCGNDAGATATNATAINTQNASADLRGSFFTLPFRSVYWGGQTTDATPLILNLDAAATNRFTIAANTALAVDILLVARRSDTADKWLVARRFLGIRRDGSNNTSLIGSVQTLGTDQTDGSPTWSFTLTADDTNEALQLEVTGAASETVQWRATAFYRVV